MNEQVKEGRKEAKFKCGCLVINKPQSLGNWLMQKYYFCGVQYNSTAQLSKIISNYIYTPASISWIFETGKIKSVNSENCAHKSNSSAYKNYLGRSKNVHSQTPLCQWYIQVKWMIHSSEMNTRRRVRGPGINPVSGKTTWIWAGYFSFVCLSAWAIWEE